jgi:hypothetical protein
MEGSNAPASPRFLVLTAGLSGEEDVWCGPQTTFTTPRMAFSFHDDFIFLCT